MSKLHLHLPELPFDRSQMGPFLSPVSFSYHYDKHHAGYIKNTNALLESEGKRSGYDSLEGVIRNAPAGALLNNASQAWNHTFFWHSMTPLSQFNPLDLSEDLYRSIKSDFDGLENLRVEFASAGEQHFGSGWVWLIFNNSLKKLQVVTTHDGTNPFRDGFVPILCCDLWEHAYYIDYKNERARYLQSYWKQINWMFAKKNFEARTHIPDMTTEMKDAA